MPQSPQDRDSVAIQFSAGLLDKLAADASAQSQIEGPDREVGGLLLGMTVQEQDQTNIVIRLFTSVERDGGEGRLYHLSTTDEAFVRELVARCVKPQWSVVGFYRSHCRQGNELDEEDRKLAAENLGPSPGVFLLLTKGWFGIDEPTNWFYFAFDGAAWKRVHAPRGGLATTGDSGLSPNAPIVGASGEEPWPLTGSLQDSPDKPDDDEPLPSLPFARKLRLPALVNGSTRRFAALIFVALLAGIMTVSWIWHRPGGTARQTAGAFSQLGLRAQIELDHVRVAWNPKGAAVSKATAGILSVADGQFHNTIVLNKETLRAGSIVYYPLEQAVTFELQIGAGEESQSVNSSQVAAEARALANDLPVAGTIAAPRDRERPARTGRNTAGIASLENKAPEHELRQTQTKRRPLSAAVLELASRAVQPDTARRASIALSSPPDFSDAPVPSLSAQVRLPPFSPVPTPFTPPETRQKEDEQIQFISPQAVRHVAPQASPNAVRLLVSKITIQVLVHIDVRGRVVRAQSLSHGGGLVDYLSSLAVNAARQWLFTPARRAGREVESDTVVQFDFDNS